MRFVTMKPPTTLIVAITTAKKPKKLAAPPASAPNAKRAPTKVIPEIAFEPDINGVCNVGGTLVINSKPRKIAITNNVTNNMSISIVLSIIYSFSDSAFSGAAASALAIGARPNKSRMRACGTSLL